MWAATSSLVLHVLGKQQDVSWPFPPPPDPTAEQSSYAWILQLYRDLKKQFKWVPLFVCWDAE